MDTVVYVSEQLANPKISNRNVLGGTLLDPLPTTADRYKVQLYVRCADSDIIMNLYVIDPATGRERIVAQGHQVKGIPTANFDATPFPSGGFDDPILLYNVEAGSQIRLDLLGNSATARINYFVAAVATHSQ